MRPHISGKALARTIESLLSDCPGALMTLHDPVIGLMVDQYALDHWTEGLLFTLSSVEWHPYARVIGLYSTAIGSHPYLDVVAILLRPYPPLDEVLAAPSQETVECGFAGMLELTLNKRLLPQLDELKRTRLTPGGKIDQADSGSASKVAASDDASDGEGEDGEEQPAKPTSTPDRNSQTRSYEHDVEMLYPICLFQVCCQFNRGTGAI